MEITKYGFAVLETDNFISRWAVESKRLDHDQSSLSQILKYVKEGDTVIDAGGYIGDTGIAYARSVGEKGCVLIFEPNPKAYEVLKYNTKELPQVKCFPHALSFTGDKNKYVIDYNIENVGASYLKRNEKGENFSISVDSMNLKELHLLKADIEGHELHMLNGAKETIERLRPIIVLEINRGALVRNSHTPEMIFEFLDKMNYFYRNIYEREQMRGDQYDIIAFPK